MESAGYLGWGATFLRTPDSTTAQAHVGRLWRQAAQSKVPQVALGFWIIKIAATTLGETGGDALSMGLGLGYLTSTAIFFGLFLLLAAAQIRSRTFHPYLYWAAVVGTTLAGTTMADFADRSLGLGYPGGTAIIFSLLLASLAAWKLTLGSVSVNRIVSPQAEVFYWLTILLSNTLGTALGDWTSQGTGFGGGVFLFLCLLAVVAALYAFTTLSRTALFWIAFILTRPLGAALGDLLTKPHAAGGFALSRALSSAVIALVMLTCIRIFPQRAGDHPGAEL